jgi:urease accessory protein
MILLAQGPAIAHHAMERALPATLAQGLLSGLGHPIIGLDHLAAVAAIGCIASWHQAGWRLLVASVLAMMAGAAAHVQGLGVPVSEVLVALSVIALGAVLMFGRLLPSALALGLFALVGLLHGYALGESIVGAEKTPLVAYFAGLAAVQVAIGLAAMAAARVLADRYVAMLTPMRAVGAVVALVGVASLVGQ